MHSSKWTHSICEACYDVKEPGRDPVRIKDDVPAFCCFCGKRTKDGIYYRASPSDAKFCKKN